MPQNTYGLADTFVLVDKLIEQNVDYLHFSLLNAVSQKPLDASDSDTPISKILSDYVKDRVPVLVAGSMNTPEDATQVLDYGISMVAIARALVVNPNWVELVQSGQTEKITSVLKISTVEEKKIPLKLMTILNSIKGFIPMEE